MWPIPEYDIVLWVSWYLHCPALFQHDKSPRLHTPHISDHSSFTTSPHLPQSPFFSGARYLQHRAHFPDEGLDTTSPTLTPSSSKFASATVSPLLKSFSSRNFSLLAYPSVWMKTLLTTKIAASCDDMLSLKSEVREPLDSDGKKICTSDSKPDPISFFSRRISCAALIASLAFWMYLNLVSKSFCSLFSPSLFLAAGFQILINGCSKLFLI